MSDDRPISVHRASLLGFFRTQMAPLLLAAFGVMIIGASFLPSKEGPTVAFWMGVAGSVAAALCVAYAAWAYTGVIKRVTIYPDRVEWRGPKGDEIASWQDVEAVYRTEIITNGNMTTRQVILRTHDGAEAVFMYVLGNWAQMAETLQVETAKVLGPPALKRYAAGKAVKFGATTVSTSGVTLEGKTLTWDGVARTAIQNGYYQVYLPGEEWPSHAVSLGETPNLLVFLRVLELTPKPPFTGPDLRKRG